MMKTVESYTVHRTVVKYPIEFIDDEFIGGTAIIDECDNGTASITWNGDAEKFNLSDPEERADFEALKKRYLD